MSKHIGKLSVRIIIAVILGLLFASSRTTLEKPCSTAPPGESIERCTSFPDAISYPSDLINNEQDSLVRFSVTFAQVSIVSFGVFSGVAWYKRRDQE